MIQSVYATLLADPAFTAPLTGGVYEQWRHNELSRQHTPLAFDVDEELLPCALLTADYTEPFHPQGDEVFIRMERQYFSIWFYQRFRYFHILQARHRAYKLLHDVHLKPSMFPFNAPVQQDKAYRIQHIETTQTEEDGDIDARVIVARFCVMIDRCAFEFEC